MMLLANLTDEQMLLDQVEDTIKEYKLVQSKHTKSNVEFTIMVLMMKWGIELEGGLDKLQAKLELNRKGIELLNPKSGN